MRRDSPAEIGARLAHVRAGARQPEHAGALGVPLRTYQNYERGEREPDLRTLLALIDQGWNVNWLLTGEGPERIDGTAAGHSLPSQPVKLDRETLARSARILDLALEIARIPVGPSLRAELLADVYEHLCSRGSDGDQLLEITDTLKAKLQEIQQSRDARTGLEAGPAAGQEDEGGS